MAPDIKWIGSPNKTKGRGGFRPEAVVVHIMEGTLAGTDSWFKKNASKVSAHYGIGRDGIVHQYVLETDTAFHAGRRLNPTWELIKDGVNPNRYTIGIEHEGNDSSAWPQAMYEATATAKKLKTVDAGTELAYIGWTSNGQTVGGNSHWYKDKDGNYFWAGGTQQPTPGI